MIPGTLAARIYTRKTVGMVRERKERETERKRERVDEERDASLRASRLKGGERGGRESSISGRDIPLFRARIPFAFRRSIRVTHRNTDEHRREIIK